MGVWVSECVYLRVWACLLARVCRNPVWHRCQGIGLWKWGTFMSTDLEKWPLTLVGIVSYLIRCWGANRLSVIQTTLIKHRGGGKYSWLLESTPLMGLQTRLVPGGFFSFCLFASVGRLVGDKRGRSGGNLLSVFLLWVFAGFSQGFSHGFRRVFAGLAAIGDIRK